MHKQHWADFEVVWQRYALALCQLPSSFIFCDCCFLAFFLSILFLSVFSLCFRCCVLLHSWYLSYWESVHMPSVLWHCWLGGRKGIWPVKIWGDGGGGHWLVRIEWRPARWSVCLPLLIFPCTIKSSSSLLTPAYPGALGKRDVKQLW